MKYSDGLKYAIRETETLLIDIHPPEDIITEWVLLNRDGRLTLRRGFCWDGPTDPAPDLKTAMRASAYHDALYRSIRQGFLTSSHKDAADLLLKKICLESGMPHYLAQTFYSAVSRLGDPYIDPEAEKAVIEAP